jgi:hypothetical protein
LNAIQALSQLSYGPSREQKTEVNDRKSETNRQASAQAGGGIQYAPPLQ